MSTIVVGVDGSPGSVGALKFALAEARTRGSDVKVVTAWHVPVPAYSGGFMPPVLDPHDFEQVAETGLTHALDEAGAAATGVKLTQVVRQGQAADVLVAEARGADLLVVGSRGLGGFKGLMLGSVSQQCTHHAECPVAVVPNGSRPS